MTKDFIGYTKVQRSEIEKALEGFSKWNDDWWDKLQEYRRIRIEQYDNKLTSKILKRIGYNPNENDKVNSFGGTYFNFEYYAVQGIVPQKGREEFHEYYTYQLNDTADKLRSLIKVSNSIPMVSAEGCQFIRRFGGYDL